MSTHLESAPNGDGEVFTYRVERVDHEGFEKPDLDEARILLEGDGITVLDAHVVGGDTQSRQRRGEVYVRPSLAQENRARMRKLGFGVTKPVFQV